MTDLKGYCLTCGKHTLNAGGFHTCYENPVIAHFKARIAELGGELEMTQSALAHTWGQGGEWLTNSVWVCEEHPWLLWPDNDPDCAGPGMPPVNLRAQLAERDMPCMWTIDFNERNECVGFTAECNRWAYEERGKFCPDCGHPVEVKEEK